jgi:hypothetical protein
MDAFAALAEHLRSRRSAILERCRHAAESASPPLISAAFSAAELCAHVPAALESLEHYLVSADPSAAEPASAPIAVALGDQRWRQSRSIADVVREVTLLEMIVLEELDAFEQLHPDLRPGLMTAARKRLAEFCGSFTALTVTEYANARHAAAASQINRLELDLNRTAERERERALSWRKAAHDLRGSLSVIGNASSVLVLPNVPEQMRVECGAILERGVDTLRSRLEACLDQAQQSAAT